MRLFDGFIENATSAAGSVYEKLLMWQTFDKNERFGMTTPS